MSVRRTCIDSSATSENIRELLLCASLDILTAAEVELQGEQKYDRVELKPFCSSSSD